MLIARIQELLGNYPQVTHEVAHGFLRIPAQSPSGFRVWVVELADEYTVGFEGWHKEFTDRESAFNCFVFGLTAACKLKVHRRGGKDYRWQVFHRVNDMWTMESDDGLLFFPFWKRREERDLQNDIFPNQ